MTCSACWCRPAVCRAWALQQRGWVGDAAFALRDCECVLALDSHSSDAMLLRAQLLLQLGQLEVCVLIYIAAGSYTMFALKQTR